MSSASVNRQGETGFSLLLIVFSVTAFWQSYSISGFTGLSTPGVFPMLASASMVVAALFILAENLRQPHQLQPESTSIQRFIQTVLPQRLVVVVLLITGYVVAMPLLGFLVASATFLFLSFSYLWRKSLFISCFITIGSVITVYLVFRKLFQVVLPNGTLIQGWF